MEWTSECCSVSILCSHEIVSALWMCTRQMQNIVFQRKWIYSENFSLPKIRCSMSFCLRTYLWLSSSSCRSPFPSFPILPAPFHISRLSAFQLRSFVPTACLNRKRKKQRSMAVWDVEMRDALLSLNAKILSLLQPDAWSAYCECSLKSMSAGEWARAYFYKQWHVLNVWIFTMTMILIRLIVL